MDDRGFKLSAVIVGLVADIGGTIAIVTVATSFVGVRMLGDGVPPEALEEHMLELLGTEPWLGIGHAIGFVCTALGGYVAARMAPHEPLKHAAVTGTGSLVLGLAASGADFGQMPFLYQALTLVGTVPAACLGGWLRRGPGPASAASDPRVPSLPRPIR